MKKLFLLFVIIIAFFLEGCVSGKITSNKEPGYTTKITKIYIIVNNPKDKYQFDERLLNELLTTLKQKNVLADGYARDPLSLETNEEINEKINKYGPDALLLIKQTAIIYYNGGPGAGTFDLTLIDRQTKKNIWKGVLDIQGPWNSDRTIDAIVEKLVNKLKEDQII